MHPARLCLISLLLLQPLTAVRAQTPKVATVPTPAYDVVSITPNKSDSNNMFINTEDATFTATNLKLRNLLSFAFSIREDLISGLPGWADSSHFNITAKIVDPDLPSLQKLTNQQRNSMLAAILTDRFHLKTHTEIKQLSVYNLVVLPRGPKFKPSAIQDARQANWRSENTSLTLTSSPLSSLTEELSSQLQRTVIDQTHLSALYDLHLAWAPDRPAAAAGLDTGQPADTGPSLFSALQDQLGLKLVPAKGPVTTLVIDHVDPPTPN